MAQSQFFCARCSQYVLASRPDPNHSSNLLVILIFFLIGIFTCGCGWVIGAAWFILWISATVIYPLLNPMRCTQCGSTYSGAKRIVRQMNSPPPLPSNPQTTIDIPMPKFDLARRIAWARTFATDLAAPFMAMKRDAQVATIATVFLVLFVGALVYMSMIS